MWRARIIFSAAAGLLGLVAQARDFSAAERQHWAFQKISPAPIPEARTRWSANPVDAYISAALEPKGLAPSPSTDKSTLIRRATFDLTGLPPAPEEVEAFVADDSSGAFEKVIDRLLLSPHYGERWARHWLDLARYAESEGFKADETRPNVWRYRDYVINSFNADKPYDRFLSEQIAGDELWPEDPAALVATGFNRHYPDESNARNLRQRRQEILNDITDTAGAVFTGLTFGCARCHDHKFDPILHQDYYRLQAFFANAAAVDELPLLSAAKLDDYRRRLSAWEDATREVRAKIAALEEPKRREIIADYVEKYPAEIQAALAKAPEERTPFECQMVAKAELYVKPSSHQYIAGKIGAALKGEKKKAWDALSEELKKFEHLHPGALPIATGISDLSAAAPKTYVLKGGSWEAPIEEVEPGFLSILNTAATPVFTPPHLKSTGRRTALARLLTDPENPLTARVMANRVWQHHFGRGIAATSSDFGVQGERPTHPELLDFLAARFMQDGWSLKKLHKLVMLSAAYQQSSQFRADAAAADPENKLLWRFPRQRLEGEVIRDAALTVSGLLDRRMGGPSIYPELPSGMMGTNSYGGWKVSEKPEDRNRRSIYVYVKRNLRYPMFETFDMPDTHESCARRNTTTSPLQALTMLNNKLAFEWAQAFASRIQSSAGSDPARAIDAAYRLAYSRTPSVAEKELAARFFADHPAVLAERGIEAQTATLVDFCHMLLNSNEFVYLN